MTHEQAMSGVPLREQAPIGRRLVRERRRFAEAIAVPPTHIAFTVAEAEALIDPNDPAVRERLVASFDRSARAIFDYGMAGDGCDPQTLEAMRDDLLAALRGAK